MVPPPAPSLSAAPRKGFGLLKTNPEKGLGTPMPNISLGEPSFPS